jgi:hypothetical protein
MNKTVKRNLPLIGVLGMLVLFSTACTLDDVLTIAKIIGIFL